MLESLQLLRVQLWFFAGYSGLLHRLQQASHELAAIHYCTLSVRIGCLYCMCRYYHGYFPLLAYSAG